MAKSVKWMFPKKYFLKIELFVLAILAVLVFILVQWQWRDVLLTLGATVVFIVLYFVVAFLVQLVRKVEEKYHFHPPHLEIVRKTRFSKTVEKVHIKDIKKHKLDHFFLGGYILTKKGKKHLLFFNHHNELKRFEEMLLKHVKTKK